MRLFGHLCTGKTLSWYENGEEKREVTPCPVCGEPEILVCTDRAMIEAAWKMVDMTDEELEEHNHNVLKHYNHKDYEVSL